MTCDDDTRRLWFDAMGQAYRVPSAAPAEPDDPFMMGWEAACAGKPRAAPDAATAAAWLDGYDSVPPLGDD